jgi:HEAT repeat protein
MARRRTASFLAAILALELGCAHKPAYEGRSVAELVRMLDDPNPTVRVQGAQGLSEHGPEARAAVPSLVKALQSPDSLLRQHAALALGAIGPDARDAVPALITILDDPEWSVRRQAVLALGAIGPAARRSAAVLQRLRTSDPNSLVRKAAEEALTKIGGG